MSESRPDYNKKKFKEEKSNKPDVFLKDKYFNAAKIILEDTPKYLGFKYSVRLKEENIDEIAFLNDERKKNKDALIFKVFKDYEILKILHQVKRDYERNNTNFSSYGIDKADTEVLANALYLSKHPDVVAGKDALPVNIYSSDDHLSQGVRVVNEKYSKIKDKIRINNFNM